MKVLILLVVFFILFKFTKLKLNIENLEKNLNNKNIKY